jgi:hypothetical protein
MIEVPAVPPRRRDRKVCAYCEASPQACRSNEWLRARRCCEACEGDHDAGFFETTTAVDYVAVDLSPTLPVVPGRGNPSECVVADVVASGSVSEKSAGGGRP